MKLLLNSKERYELEKLVEQKRNMYDLGTGPLGDGILQLVAQLNINMLYLPKDPKTDEEPLSAIYLSSKEKNGNNLSFIGVNTAQHYDSQLFSIAHELYHHFENTNEVYLCRGIENADGLRELKANHFAASFLLPSKSLIEEIYEKNNYELNIDNWSFPTLLRFIARLHLDYKLPYKAIVRRLTEVNALTDEKLFQSLWTQDVRDEASIYYRIAMSYDADLFILLNKKTRKIGADARFLELMLQNFEGAFVGVDELADDLSLFGKRLGEFGFAEEEHVNVMDELMRELEEDDEG